MLYVFDRFERLAPGLWRVTMPRIHLPHLQIDEIPFSRYSIVSGKIEERNGELRLNSGEAKVVLCGTSDDTLIVDADHANVRDSSITRYSEISSDRTRTPSDEAFLTACASLVGPELRKLGELLLAGFRSDFAGSLVEGKSRKWTNTPLNFLAITIQNRNRSFAISIREVPEAKGSTLGPKPDRPGYLRFKVETEADLPEAVRLIRASARR